MPTYKYPVALSPGQREELKTLCGRGAISARKLARARILLLADQNRHQGAMDDHQIHDVRDVSRATIRRVRKKFTTGGLETALEELSRSGRPLKFDGYQRAQITALACSEPPEITI